MRNLQTKQLVKLIFIAFLCYDNCFSQQKQTSSIYVYILNLKCTRWPNTRLYNIKIINRRQQHLMEIHTNKTHNLCKHAITRLGFCLQNKEIKTLYRASNSIFDF